MIKLYSPNDEAELAMIKSLLTAAQIPYHVHNEHFGGLYVGPQIRHFNQRMIMVPPAFEIAAREVISEYLIRNEPRPEAREEREEKASIWDKLRMGLEVLFFCWIVPGKRKRTKSAEKKINRSKDSSWKK